MTIEDLRTTVFERGDLPQHIAIIMDGNGRWAKAQGLSRLTGHREGINSVREITRICGEIRISHLTLYTFSQENWSRPPTEVSALMKLLLTTIRKEVDSLNKNNVRLSAIGEISDLPVNARKGIEEGIEKTRNNTGLNLNLALSYGGRQELILAVKEICKKIELGILSSDAVNEETISENLYTADIPDPDLLIRTGGEFRISNFLLWQIAYTELYITPVFWPGFREKQLLEAISSFQNRERRFGGVIEQDHS